MIDRNLLRAWWFQKQKLDDSLNGASPAKVLEDTGWARSVGGANPYITLFSRGKISRQAADKAAASLQIHELPSARGCTYVLPASDFALGLTVGQGFGDEASIQTAIKFLGVTEKEIQKLMDQVRKSLETGAKDPKEMKQTLGDAVRNLGDAGKKKGVTTTLPLALGRLQSSGCIRRIPVDGRLDQQRYSYTLWKPSPLDQKKTNTDSAFTELARKYFRWIGPATVKEFQWFSALGVKAAKAAIEPLKLVPVDKETELLILPDELDDLKSFKIPKKPAYALVSSLDGLFLLRRNISDFLDEKDLKRKVFTDKSEKPLSALQDLPSHAILDRGRIIGLWEYDPSSNTIAWTCFIDADKGLKNAIAETESFVTEQLGDVRSFSLDSPESRKPRIASLKKSL